MKVREAVHVRVRSVVTLFVSYVSKMCHHHTTDSHLFVYIEYITSNNIMRYERNYRDQRDCPSPHDCVKSIKLPFSKYSFYILPTLLSTGTLQIFCIIEKYVIFLDFS